jgi:hypothetical protein
VPELSGGVVHHHIYELIEESDGEKRPKDLLPAVVVKLSPVLRAEGLFPVLIAWSILGGVDQKEYIP